MSSIRSASSSTSVRTWASDTAPRAIRSSSRPGVATSDLRAAGGADLLLEADPAVDGGNLEAAGAQQRPRVLDDLGGELAGRREHQRRGARPATPDAIGERHGERERLARPGRRLGQHVATGEHVADHEPLDRERPLDALGGEGVHDRGGYAEIGER